jgi:hypothetical protein
MNNLVILVSIAILLIVQQSIECSAKPTDTDPLSQRHSIERRDDPKEIAQLELKGNRNFYQKSNDFYVVLPDKSNLRPRKEDEKPRPNVMFRSKQPETAPQGKTVQKYSSKSSDSTESKEGTLSKIFRYASLTLMLVIVIGVNLIVFVAIRTGSLQ